MAFHASLSQPMVDKLVALVAEDRGITFEAAQGVLARRWEERAHLSIRAGWSTWLMWDEMGMMALRASPPPGYDRR